MNWLISCYNAINIHDFIFICIGKKIKLIVLMDSVLVMSLSNVGFETISRNDMVVFKLLVAVCNAEYLYFLVSV